VGKHILSGFLLGTLPYVERVEKKKREGDTEKERSTRNTKNFRNYLESVNIVGRRRRSCMGQVGFVPPFALDLFLENERRERNNTHRRRMSSSSGEDIMSRDIS